jgi:hypothetical protein
LALPIRWSGQWLEDAIARRSAAATPMFKAAGMLLFLSALAVAMNAFLSWRPISPWAGIAITLGTLAASLGLIGAMLLYFGRS